MNTPPIADQDLEELRAAKQRLEHPNLAIKIASSLGTPIEKLMHWLPRSVESKVADITQAALSKAADAAIYTIKDTPGEPASTTWHKLAAAASGAGGGFFGMAGLPVELPISTTIILRSIADIARSHGFSMSDVETQRQCIAVLALGGKSGADDGADAGYLAARAGLAKAIGEGGSKLISTVATRFSIQVSQKAASQAAPFLGAAGGAIVNTVFIDHFQEMARAHFTVLRLSKKYGAAAIDTAYKQLPAPP